MENMDAWEGFRSRLLLDLTTDAKILLDKGDVFSGEMDMLKKRGMTELRP
jgi:hypothetical protein